MRELKRKIVVGFSGGVTSAWCAVWALSQYPKDEVVFLFHDTKEEDVDTYRFLYEVAKKLNHPVTERSDGRSVTELAYDEHMLPNDRVAFCSRTLKAEQRAKYFDELRAEGFNSIILILGFTANEWKRIQRYVVEAANNNFAVRFPLSEGKVVKQVAADFIQCTLGIPLPRMYEWSGHANCVGCVRGGKNYWWAVKLNAPEVFAQRAALEREFRHTFINGVYLDELTKPQKYFDKESIEIGSCECGS